MLTPTSMPACSPRTCRIIAGYSVNDLPPAIRSMLQSGGAPWAPVTSSHPQLPIIRTAARAQSWQQIKHTEGAALTGSLGRALLTWRWWLQPGCRSLVALTTHTP